MTNFARTQLMINVYDRILEGLVNTYGSTHAVGDIIATFNAVAARHEEAASIPSFIPVLVEKEMKDRLKAGNLIGATEEMVAA